MIVDVPIDPKGMVDVYIENTIGLTIDLPQSDNVKDSKKQSSWQSTLQHARNISQGQFQEKRWQP